MNLGGYSIYVYGQGGGIDEREQLLFDSLAKQLVGWLEEMRRRGWWCTDTEYRYCDAANIPPSPLPPSPPIRSIGTLDPHEVKKPSH